MKTQTIWSEQTSVKTFETDFQQKWKISGFFQAMQEAATHHASNLGFDFEKMQAQDMSWILSRVKIHFSAFPSMGETVTLRTWPKGIQQKIFFMRDFQIYGENSRELAQATTAWLLINTRHRRILPPQSLTAGLPDNGGLYALDEVLDKIPFPDSMEERLQVRAGYSAIDLMGHVNNARYIDWVCDCFPQEQFRQQQLASLQINYIHEIRPEENILVSAGKEPDGSMQWSISGLNQTNGTKAFESAVVWRSA